VGSGWIFQQAKEAEDSRRVQGPGGV